MNEFNWSFQHTRFAGISWIPENYSRVMIIIHGIGEHVGRYEQVAAFFMQQGFAVMGIDHYGHGKSDGKRGTTPGFDFMFDYLAAFLAHVTATYNKPVVMYGHSMGGGLLTGFLLKRQPALQAAVISAPALIVGAKPGAFLKGVLRVLSAVAPNFRIAQGLDINKISHDKTAVEKFRNDPLRHDRLSLRLANDMIRNGAWCLSHADQLTVKTLLLHGNADAFTAVEGSRLFAQRAPASLLTYQEWNGYYHELHNEFSWKEVGLYIAGWLSAIK
ncbi:alpha/beta hydrolase [Chitinophaga nivalis]|uniref:Lysophospholipase n=1 Tax=Chitinophaga nivalis TaxID=2991709 RepID=A0ABT3IHE9_9BACT|nr:alpha/beta hydrolase [Chitinophaga nivalis]MCW3466923.1 lysophospholipase [Chitinophaga nivalis]MCW3483386.1 lysophospholipase [Chitinophaga nivalis]